MAPIRVAAQHAHRRLYAFEACALWAVHGLGLSMMLCMIKVSFRAIASRPRCSPLQCRCRRLCRAYLHRLLTCSTSPPPPFLSLPQVLRKLEGSLAAGQFYEAHEMFKTVYYRHRARGQAEQSYELAAVRLLGSMLCWIH